MTQSVKIINDTWLKASVLGATWAASEIILGSFLHNLHVPFKGNILTAIGIILLITASYKWKNKGLFWRSGLICALMKTMSPSAVIFGPMIAIFAEALLFEISVRTLGKNTIGFMLGAVLAMSWVLFQKIFNLVLIYGLNLVKIYDNLLLYIEKQLDWQSELFWLPLLAMLAVYTLFGVFAVLLGIRIGRKIETEPQRFIFETNYTDNEYDKRVKVEFPHSIAWLVFSFAALVSALILISRIQWYFWLPFSIALLTVWVLRYKRGMRQLAKPRFWVSFVILTVLACLLLTSVDSSANSWIDGLWLGFEMNVRAAIVVVGFSVLGTELYNPKIRNYLSGTKYQQAGTALELAFESLPYVVGHLPDAKTFMTQPGRVVRLLIHHAEYRFNELNRKQHLRVFIVSGGVAEGKTSFLTDLIKELRMENRKLSGFVSPRVLNGNETIGYDIENVDTKERFPLMRKEQVQNKNSSEKIGHFAIRKEKQQEAKQILEAASLNGAEIVVVDEVGRLEIRGEGWHNELQKLLQKEKKYLVLAVRDVFVDEVIRKFDLHNTQVFNVKSSSPEIVKKIICGGEIASIG